ncbi:hypothetical protein B5807_08002 [Epicoccum nigrum]|uniref:Uncharacterized protein n=1 Tax=Epicoccum nigrum TaxID=105696 RepID=A0A1Y2LPV2_EPING|nr:hypothetical protein B5807_08002 [Epicoccum nigrum]
MALPNLRTMHIEGCDELRITHNFSAGASHRLESLEIIQTIGSVYEIRELFENNHARDLKRLVFQNFSIYPNGSFQPVVDTLLTNCSYLEYFELSAHEELSDPDPEPLKGLSGLNSLKELRIDMDYLVSVEDRMGLLSLEGLLPPNLERIHVTGICAFEFCDFVEQYMVPLYHTQSGMTRMCEFASLCSPKTVIVTITSRMNFEDEWKKVVPVLIRIAAVLWAEVKVSFSVYGSAWGNETKDKLLIDHEGGSETSVFFHELEDLTTDFPVHHDGERLFRLTTLSNLRNLCTNSLYLRSRESQDQLLDSGGLLPPKLTVLQIRGVAYADIGRLMLENSPKGPPALRPFFPGGPSLEKLCFHVKNKNVESERYDTLLASIAKILRARGVEFQVHGNSIATNKLQPLIKLDNPVTQQE